MELGEYLSYEITSSMKPILFCLLSILLVACGSSEEKMLLSSGEIALSQPRIELKDRMLDGPQWVKASLGIEGSRIFYTLDGTEPTEESSVFKDSLLIKKPGQLSIRAFHRDFQPSETSRIDFIEKGMDIKNISWLTSLNQKYSGAGENTLTDHKKGSTNFSSAKWLGFDSIARVRIELKEATSIDRMELGYLVQTGSWIFPPSKVKFYASDAEAGTEVSDKPFVLIEEFSLEPLAEHMSTLETLVMPIERNVKIFELEFHNQNSLPAWHDGAGKEGWLFMDELILYEKK